MRTKILANFHICISVPLNVATFMYKINQKTALNVFTQDLKNRLIFFQTRVSELNYVQPIHNIKTSKYLISIKGPYVCNSFLSPEEKQITTMHKFKAITKLQI